MRNQEEPNLGDQIKNVVQSAIDSQNFRQLNDSIKNTINSAMDNVNQSLNQAGMDMNRYKNKERVQPQNPWDSRKGCFGMDKPKNPANELFTSGTGTAGEGYALTIIGYLFAAGLGIATIVLLLITLVTRHIGFGPTLACAIMFPFLLGSGFMAWKGSRILARLKRFKIYVRQLGGRKFCTIKELAEFSDKSESFVMKDVKDMIRRNMFCQGHFDRQGTCLMVSDEIYQLYLTTQSQLEAKQREEKAKEKAEQVPTKEKELPNDVKKVVEEGNAYIRKIKESNNAIPDQEISTKISRLELITSKIFQRVEQHPEHIPDLRKFIEYYLPTTTKLLKAYEDLEAQPVQGTNIESSKQEIAATLDTINQAFEKLLDSFFQDTSWDISSDISVLQTMFAQEGLTGQDFKR